MTTTTNAPSPQVHEPRPQPAAGLDVLQGLLDGGQNGSTAVNGPEAAINVLPDSTPERGRLRDLASSVGRVVVRGLADVAVGAGQGLLEAGRGVVGSDIRAPHMYELPPAKIPLPIKTTARTPAPAPRVSGPPANLPQPAMEQLPARAPNVISDLSPADKASLAEMYAQRQAADAGANNDSTPNIVEPDTIEMPAVVERKQRDEAWKKDVAVATQLAIDNDGISIQKLIEAKFKRPKARELMQALIDDGVVEADAKPKQPHKLIVAPNTEPSFDQLLNPNATEVDNTDATLEPGPKGLKALRERIQDLKLQGAAAVHIALLRAPEYVKKVQEKYGTRGVIAGGIAGTIVAYAAYSAGEHVIGLLNHAQDVAQGASPQKLNVIGGSGLIPRQLSSISADALPKGSIDTSVFGKTNQVPFAVRNPGGNINIQDILPDAPKVPSGGELLFSTDVNSLDIKPNETVWEALVSHNVPPSRIMNTLVQASRAAKEHGVDVQWHGNGAARWVEVGGKSDTSSVIKALAPYLTK